MIHLNFKTESRVPFFSLERIQKSVWIKVNNMQLFQYNFAETISYNISQLKLDLKSCQWIKNYFFLP